MTAPMEAPLWRMPLPSVRFFFVEDVRTVRRAQCQCPASERFRNRDATDEQPVIDPGADGITGVFEQRGEPGLTGKGRGDACERPSAEDKGIEESGTCPVGDDAEEDGPEGEGISEAAFDHPDRVSARLNCDLRAGSVTARAWRSM